MRNITQCFEENPEYIEMNMKQICLVAEIIKTIVFSQYSAFLNYIFMWNELQKIKYVNQVIN